METKSYICLFTCASTRAVHLELTHGLDVNSFLLAFRRFVGRRGLPATIISDNATTFRSSAKELKRITRSPEVFKYLTENGVMWKFIVEKAPWWGGFWERMIRTVKSCLKKTIGRATLTQEELCTILVEIEAVVNSRPLTYVEDDREGISQPLTPSHLVNGRRIANTPSGEYFEVVSNSETLTRRARHHRKLLSQVTKQWKKSYLTSLRETHLLRNKKHGKEQITVGDVVLLKDDCSKRMFWKLAVVTELITGTDNKVRAAVIKVGDSPRPLKRSITHLIPLELNCQDS